MCFFIMYIRAASTRHSLTGWRGRGRSPAPHKWYNLCVSQYKVPGLACSTLYNVRHSDVTENHQPFQTKIDSSKRVVRIIWAKLAKTIKCGFCLAGVPSQNHFLPLLGESNKLFEIVFFLSLGIFDNLMKSQSLALFKSMVTSVGHYQQVRNILYDVELCMKVVILIAEREANILISHKSMAWRSVVSAICVYILIFSIFSFFRWWWNNLWLICWQGWFCFYTQQLLWYTWN